MAKAAAVYKVYTVRITVESDLLGEHGDSMITEEALQRAVYRVLKPYSSTFLASGVSVDILEGSVDESTEYE
jgi:hypothetical protein